MALNSSTQEEVRSALRDLLGRGEEVVNVFLEELTGSSNLREELEKTLRRANRARETVDNNMETVLGALNLPTRRDYKKLVHEIHALQGAVLNLNMKLDRLIAMATPPAAEKPRAASRTAEKKAKSKPRAARKSDARPTRKRKARAASR